MAGVGAAARPSPGSLREPTSPAGRESWGMLASRTEPGSRRGEALDQVRGRLPRATQGPSESLLPRKLGDKPRPRSWKDVGGIGEPALEAMLRMPRHLFFPEPSGCSHLPAQAAADQVSAQTAVDTLKGTATGRAASLMTDVQQGPSGPELVMRTSGIEPVQATPVSMTRPR